jgi:hypothetical protein
MAGSSASSGREFSPLSDAGFGGLSRKMIINHILQYAEEYHG